MAQNLPVLPDWERISTNVIRILGGNPSKFTLQGTNTYLLGRGSQRILIDTGAGEKKWIDTLSTVLESEKASVSTCLLTHWHQDHLGGVKDLEKLSAETGKDEVKVYKNIPTFNPDGLLVDPSRVNDITDGQKFSTQGTSPSSTLTEEGDAVFEIQAIHTPGHAKDHMVFQITSSPDASEIGALFTADNVLGHGTAVFENLQLYLNSLDVMRKRVSASIVAQNARQGRDVDSGEGVEGLKVEKKRAYPGHGAVIEDAVGKIDEYITHRRMREEEALNVLRYGTVKAPGANQATVKDSITNVGESDSETELTTAKEVVAGKEWESMEMVKVIYRHYPESLYQPAEFGLLMVLEKLKKDGKVVQTAERRWRISEKATL